MAKLFDCFEKSGKIKDLTTVLEKSTLEKSMIHKYIRREGTPGNYKYIYKAPDGMEVQGGKPDKEAPSANSLFTPELDMFIRNWENKGGKLGVTFPDPSFQSMKNIARIIANLKPENEFLMTPEKKANYIERLKENIDRMDSDTVKAWKGYKTASKYLPEVKKFYGKLIMKKSKIDELVEILTKGRKPYPTGMVRTWQGRDYIKQANGEWVPKGESKPTPDDRPLTDEGKPSEVTDESIAEAFRQGEAHHKADLIPLPKDINGLREYLEAGTKKHGGKNQFLASAEYLEAEPTLRAMYDDYKREKKEKEKEAKIAREVETARTKQNSPEIQANDVTAKLKAELEDSKTKAILTDAQTRAEADKALQKDLTEDNGEYTYARKSEIGNQGADIKASARHRRHQWDGLDNAENSDDVNKYVKRDVILKEFPVDFISGMTPENMESRLAWYYVLKTLPAKPADLALRPNSDGFVKYLTPEGRIVGSKFMEKDSAGLKGLTMAEYSKMERKNYVESLLRAKDFIESKVKVDNQSGYGVLQSMTDFIRLETESLRDVDTYSPTANLWAKYWKSKLKRGSDTSVSGQVALALHHADYPQGAKGLANQSPLDSKERMELFTKLIEGKSLDSLKGIKRDVLKSEADFYQTPVDRKGPEYSNLKDVKAQTDLLMDKIKLKGLQWGNSVTDDERKYHLKQLSYAFKDLAEVTGLPEKFISLNGKLAMAIGARGKGRALAHYERNLKVINLTRANGVGSLAHEWGHALDNIMNEVINDTSSGFLSDNSYGNRKWNPETKSYTDEFTNKTSEAMVNLLNSEAWANYRKKATATYNGLSQHITKGADYWISRKEMFARLFEGYISKKLKSQDRSNSYLSSAPESDGLWPAEKTLDDLTPYVDNLLESIKNSDLIEKAMKMWAIEELNQLLKSFK